LSARNLLYNRTVLLSNSLI